MKNPFAQLLNKKPSPEEKFRRLKREYEAIYEAFSQVDGMQQKLSLGVMAAKQELVEGDGLSVDEQFWLARLFTMTFMDCYLRNAEILDPDLLDSEETKEARLKIMAHSLDMLNEQPQACFTWVESMTPNTLSAEEEALIDQVQVATL